MDAIKLAASVIAAGLLAGCPREAPVSLVNLTGADVIVVSENASVAIAADAHTRLDDFTFDLDAALAKAIRLRGSFGHSCHQVVFGGLGLPDEETGIQHPSGAMLAVGPSGDVRLISRALADSPASVTVEMFLAAPRLRACGTPARDAKAASPNGRRAG